MKTLEPNRVELTDVANWFKLALLLLTRRPVYFFLVTIIYFFAMFFVQTAITSLSESVFPIVLFSLYVAVVTFILFLVLCGFILQAEVADHSQASDFRSLLEAVISGQRVILRISIIAMFVGAFYWVVMLGFAKDTNVLQSAEQVIDTMLAQHGLPFMFECKVTATFLYFLFLATFSLRLFFALPLVAFHQLDFRHAQSLSHKAVMINIRPMTFVLMLWAILLFVVMRLAPLVSVLLFPLFGIFTYIAYRQVFLGVRDNFPAKAVLAKTKVQHQSI